MSALRKRSPNQEWLFWRSFHFSKSADTQTSLNLQKSENLIQNRNGTSSLLISCDIDQGLRYGEIHDRRTKKEFSEFMDGLEIRYIHFEKLITVLDNLNTHKYGSFYEFLELDRGAALRKKIEFVYTPKHGSWLNMIEIEFSALSNQCLNRRIATKEKLEKNS